MMIPKCDLCGDDNNDNNQSINSVIYGVVGEAHSESLKIEVNSRPSENDDFHICHSCLKILTAKFNEKLRP